MVKIRLKKVADRGGRFGVKMLMVVDIVTTRKVVRNKQKDAV